MRMGQWGVQEILLLRRNARWLLFRTSVGTGTQTRPNLLLHSILIWEAGFLLLTCEFCRALPC